MKKVDLENIDLELENVSPNENTDEPNVDEGNTPLNIKEEAFKHIAEQYANVVTESTDSVLRKASLMGLSIGETEQEVYQVFTQTSMKLNEMLLQVMLYNLFLETDVKNLDEILSESDIKMIIDGISFQKPIQTPNR